MIPDAALEAASECYHDRDGPRTVEAMLADVLAAALPHLLTDEMVEHAAAVLVGEFGYSLDSREEMYAAYWERIARRAFEAALGSTA